MQAVFTSNVRAFAPQRARRPTNVQQQARRQQRLAVRAAGDFVPSEAARVEPEVRQAAAGCAAVFGPAAPPLSAAMGVYQASHLTRCVCAQDAKGAIAIGLKFSDAGNWAQAQVRRHSAEPGAPELYLLDAEAAASGWGLPARLQGAPRAWQEQDLGWATPAAGRASATEEATDCGGRSS